MANADLARQFVESLDLELPPVAIAFVDVPPPGVKNASEVIPSACGFWRVAEKEVFYAPADAHFNCPVGAFVMGFELPEAVSAELMQLVGTMTQCGYISGDETAKIPTSTKKSKGILYGPLADFPRPADAVIAWLTPAQAMIWNEAVGGADWTGAQRMTVFGRPACAAIPSALANAKASLSLGCMGMRTFTQIGEDKMLAVIAGPNVAKAAEWVGAMRRVNDGMETFYKDRAAKLA